MIKKLVSEIAAEMSVPLSAIQLIDGRRLGINGSYFLKMTVNSAIASTILHQHHLMEMSGGAASERAGHEIRNALCRLQTLLEKQPARLREGEVP